MLAQDFWYAARLLLRAPGVTFVAILILTVGIGANTTIFTIVDAVLLRPLPYADPATIFTLWQNNTVEGIQRDKVSPSNFLDWRERSRSFAAMVAVRPWRYEYIRDNEPDILPASLVSEEFFDVLGVKPLYGRSLTREDYRQGRSDVIVVGHELWRQRFGANPGVIGQIVRFDNSQLTIVGVMPAGFYFLSKESQIWAPFVLDERHRRQRASPYLEVVARLKSGVAIDQAQAEMEVIGVQLASEYPKVNRGIGVTVVPLSEHVVSHVRPALWVLFGAVSFVLLIACANVANLLLARASERAREFAIRGALGATRTRLMRQFLVESLLVAVLGGIGGIILAFWTLHLFLALTPIDLPRVDEIHLSARVLLSTLAVSVVVALGAGFAPSLSVSKSDVLQKLKESSPTGTSGPTRHRMRVAYAFLMRESDGSTHVEMDRHREGLFPREAWLTWLKEAGFAAKCQRDRWNRDVFSGRRQTPAFCFSAASRCSGGPVPSASRHNVRETSRDKFTLPDDKRLRPHDNQLIAPCLGARPRGKQAASIARILLLSSGRHSSCSPRRGRPCRATCSAALRDRDMKRWESESEIQAQLRRLTEDARRLREEIRASLRAPRPASRRWVEDTPASAYVAVRLRPSDT